MNPQRQFWNEQQQVLRRVLLHSDHFSTAIVLFLAQHAMVHSGRISASALWSFEDEVWQGLPETSARQIPQNGEHSIAWAIWHIARIEDATMNLLVGGELQVLEQDGWLPHLGIAIRHTGNAMDVEEIADLSNRIDLKALRAYRLAVGRRTRQIVGRLRPADLKQKVDPACLQRMSEEGVVVEAARELLDYWGSLKLGELLLMPPTRHNFIHLNEALRIKQKLDKSMLESAQP